MQLVTVQRHRGRNWWSGRRKSRECARYFVLGSGHEVSESGVFVFSCQISGVIQRRRSRREGHTEDFDKGLGLRVWAQR